jgi:hypothetical protein
MELKHLKKFNEWNRTWDPSNMRKPNDARLLPPDEDMATYKKTVKEEMESFLEDTFKMEKPQIDSTVKRVWSEEFKWAWEEILSDSAINWDTPAICAQKILKKLDVHLFGGKPLGENKNIKESLEAEEWCFVNFEYFPYFKKDYNLIKCSIMFPNEHKGFEKEFGKFMVKREDKRPIGWRIGRDETEELFQCLINNLGGIKTEKELAPGLILKFVKTDKDLNPFLDFLKKNNFEEISTHAAISLDEIDTIDSNIKISYEDNKPCVEVIRYEHYKCDYKELISILK